MMTEEMRVFTDKEMAEAFCKEHTIVDVWSTIIFGERHWAITYLEE